jgi:D-amino-acid dehydrogenase
MRIAVIGAGLTGVTTAYELARDGHEVVVYERRAGIAAEGSFARGCVNAPDAHWLGAATNRPLNGPPASWGWSLRAWRAARQPARPTQLQAMAALATLGRARQNQLADELELEFDRHEGVLAIFQGARQAARAQAALAASPNAAARWLNADEVHATEPGLTTGLALHGALYWARGQSANGRQFAQALKTEAQRLGARFVFHQQVQALTTRHGPGACVELRVQPCTELADSGLPAPASTLLEDVSPQFDAVVLCSGVAAQTLVPELRLPLARLHVHSITAPLRPPNEAGEAIGPRGALIDVATGVSISHMGDRLRATSSPRWGHPPQQPDETALGMLYRTLERLFPGAARTARGQGWAGRQSTLPDGLPALGAARTGVWLNLGHGAQAWAWAPATALVTAELVAGRPPSLDASMLGVARLR